IYSGLKLNGIAIVPNNEINRLCINEAINHKKVITFGNYCSNSIWKGKVISSSLDYDCVQVSSKTEDYTWRWQFKGEHQAINASILFAVLEAINFDVIKNRVIERLEKISIPNMRGISKNINGVTWINDAYNANADSTIASLKSLADNRKHYSGRIFIVLGDILELGEAAENEHARVISFLENNSFWDYVLTVGSNYKNTSFGKNFNSSVEIGDYLSTLLKSGDCILLKGSRGMKMELVMENYFNE
ncbi:MAG: glutamate ligase domain-containing protein, partial [Lentisphaeria bacterium]